MRSRGEKTEKGHAERDNIMSLSVKERRIKGTILLSLSRNMCVRGTLYCPSYYAVFERIVYEGAILCPFQINDGKCIKGAIHCPSCEIRGETQ